MLIKMLKMMIVMVLPLSGTLMAQSEGIPHMISYQGELTDPNGEPINDPNLSMTFTFYDAPADGNSLFSETQYVDVNEGLFGLLIGSVSGPNGIPASVFAGQDVYLGIQVGTDSEMTPRQRVTSVAFAYRAEKAGDAELLGGQAASEFASSVHNHDDRYYSESEIDNLFYTKSVIDSLFYTKSEIDMMFYTKPEIDSLFYTKTELNPKLLTASQKSELTGGGVTSLHYHPTSQLEAWPTYRIGITISGSVTRNGEWELIGERSFSKVPGSTLFRVSSKCKVTGGYNPDNGIKIDTSCGTIEHHPDIVGSYVYYENLFDSSSVSDYSQLVVKIWLRANRYGDYTTTGSADVYAQQNAP